jgi:hypothetical protein
MPRPRSSDPGDQAAQAFLFADLAGFTALTEAHGDALMLRAPQAPAAVRLGCALTGELLADHGYPAIRVGSTEVAMVLDPVCRMAIDPERAAGRLDGRMK